MTEVTTDNYQEVYTTALIESIQRLNPTWDIKLQEEEITTESTNMFFNLYRVGSEDQIVDGINKYIDLVGPLNTINTYNLLRIINPVQFSIPRLTYNLVSDSIDQNKANLALIALTIKTIGYVSSNTNTKDDLYCYYYQNIWSIVADPVHNSFNLISLLAPDTITGTILLFNQFYGPFGGLKYHDITNLSYTQPIDPSEGDLVSIVTTVISERLQINPIDIEYAVNQLSNSQLMALLVTINNYPRLRTAPIKLGYDELDLFIVDGLMTTKFQAVKLYYADLFLPDKKDEARKIFSRVLLDQNMKEYSPVLLELNYQPPHLNNSVIVNIDRSKVPAMEPVKKFVKVSV